MCLYIILTAHSAAQGCLWHMIHSGIKSKACSQKDMPEKDLSLLHLVTCGHVFVSFGDKALQVVRNTEGHHLLLLQLDLLLLTRQPTKFSVLIAGPILRVIRNKNTNNSTSAGTLLSGWGERCYKEFQSLLSIEWGYCVLCKLSDPNGVGGLAAFLFYLFPSLLAQELECLCHRGQGLPMSANSPGRRLGSWLIHWAGTGHTDLALKELDSNFRLRESKPGLRSCGVKELATLGVLRTLIERGGTLVWTWAKGSCGSVPGSTGRALPPRAAR